jgi:hypothetical protein
MGLSISKKYQFVEYLGPTTNLADLSVDVLDQIDTVYTTAPDGNGYYSWSAYSGIGLISQLETGKFYLIISRSDNPSYDLYSVPDVALPYNNSIILTRRFSIFRYNIATSYLLTSSPAGLQQVYTVDSSGLGFLGWGRSGGLFDSLENNKFYLAITDGSSISITNFPTPTPTHSLTPTPTKTATPTVTPTKSVVYYGYNIRFYGKSFDGTRCVAGTTSAVRSTTPLTVGLYYWQGGIVGPCNVYQIQSSKTPSGSDPIIFFNGSSSNCLTAYNLCND